MVIRAGCPRGAGPAMAVEPGSDSGRVERWRQNAGRSIERIPPGWRTVDNSDELTDLSELGDNGRRLGAKLCDSAFAWHLGAGRGDYRS
jgi:hypothetical protein